MDNGHGGSAHSHSRLCELETLLLISMLKILTHKTQATRLHLDFMGSAFGLQQNTVAVRPRPKQINAKDEANN